MKMILRNGWIRMALFLFALLIPRHSLAQGGPMPPPPPAGQTLDLWRFEDTNWLSIRRFPPRFFTNLTLAPSWNGNCLRMDDTNPSILVYNVVDAEAGFPATNLSCVHGSLEMWFSPDWSTGDNLGDWGRLLEVGNWDTNLTTNSSAWGLYFSPDGSNLTFSGEGGGLATNWLTAPIAWNAGDWHYIVLTYDETNLALYLEGQLVTNAVWEYPMPQGRSGVQRIRHRQRRKRNRHAANARADCSTCGLYNYALDAENISDAYAQMSPSVYPLPSGGGPTMSDSGPPPFTIGGGGGSPSLSYSFDTNGLWLQVLSGTNSYSTNGNASNLTVILNNTIADIAYELFSATNLGSNITWTQEQPVLGSELTNFTVTTVSMNGRTSLFLKALAGTSGQRR